MSILDPPLLARAVVGDRAGEFHWRARLPNGAPVTAFLERDEPALAPDRLPPGAAVLLELTPFDFSRGRIIGLDPAANRSAEAEAPLQ